MRKLCFKVCPRCGGRWQTRDAFLSDPLVELIGYQFSAVALHSGLFLFNHTAPDCSTTMGIRARRFADLHDGPVFEKRVMGSPACPGHCLQEEALHACTQACECRFVRDILQIVKGWPKQAGSGFRAGGRTRATTAMRRR